MRNVKKINAFINLLTNSIPLKASLKPVELFSWFIIMTGFLLLIATQSFSQAAGDYRSNAATMNWNAAAGWQKYDGSTWAASTDYPGQNACTNCTVSIRNANTVTLNVSPANSVGNIVIGGGTNGVLTLGTFTLAVAGNLTVNTGATINLATGTLTIAGTTATAGNILDASNTGVNTFTGLVTKTAGSWTSTAVTSAANMIFAAGFTNTTGAFSAGAATVGDNQTLTGTVNMSFFNGLTVLGNADLKVAGTTGAGVTFGGTAIDYTVRNLSLTGLLTVSTTGNLMVTGTTAITGTGALTDNNNAGISSFTGLVTHNATGAWTSIAVTTPANLVFTAGFINTAGTFNAGAATIGDNQTLTGTVNMSFANGLTVLGNGDLTIAGTTSAGVSFGGTAINYAVRNLSLTGLLIVSTTGNLSVSGTTTLTGTGAFNDNNNGGVSSFTGLVTHSSTGAWTSTTVTTAANMIFTAGFTNTAGAFNAGAATIGDDKTLTGTINMNFTTGLTVSGNGDITIAGTATNGATFGGTTNYTVRNLKLTGRLSLTTSGNLTVTGTTSITGTGAFVDNSNAGSTSFTGLVTHNSTGVWSTPTVTTAANMVFTSGFTNTAGAFSAGGATISNGQTLSGTVVMVFNNPLSITGAGNITLAGSGGIRFAGTAMNYVIPGNLTLTGTLLVNTTGSFTVGGTTAITGAGDFTDNNNAGISTFTGLVTHNSTGRWVSTSVTTAANMIFSAGFTNTAGTFSAGAATIGDNKTLTGTVNMSFNRGIAILGNGDITIAGTGTTGVTFGGPLINYTVRNLALTGLLTTSTTGNLTISGTTSLSGNGRFLDNNGTGITTFTGLVTVGSTSTFTATSVTTIGRLIFAGGISQNNTTALAFNAGAIRTSATQTWSGAGDIRSAGVLDVNAGTLTNNITGTVISVGTLTGTIFVQGSNAKLSLGSTTPLSIAALTSTAGGNTVTYNSGSATMRSQTYYHLTIAGSGNKIISTTDITVNGNLTVSSGVLSNTTNNRNIVLAGNWINNVGAGGFTAGTGTVTFSGASAQTLGGTGVTTFRNLTVNNAAGITQSMSSTITGTLTLTSGIITTGTNAVIVSSTGSITRTNGHINGNEQRNIATGTNVARTFDIGDANNYTPVTITFSSVSIAGNVSVKSTGNDHPSLASALLNSTLSINRYWTLSNIGTTFTNYNAVFNFVAGDKDASLNTAVLTGGRYAGSWTYPTVGTKTSTSTQLTGLTGFGDIALAEALLCLTPTVVITDPAAFCSPATVNLTLPAVTAGSSSGLTFTYWRDAAASIVLASPSAVAVGGTYYIKGTTTVGGCSDVQPVAVTRNNPTGLISGDNTICSGSGTTLSITVTGTGPWSGTLSNGASFSGDSSTLTANVSPVAATTFTISTLTDAACTAQVTDKTGSAVINITSLPATANAGPDQSLCGASATLAANTPSVGTGSWSIVSGSGGAFDAASSPGSGFSGISGQTYVLRWSIDNAPCTASTDDVTISFANKWTGSIDSDWTNTGNWCSGAVPDGIIDLALPAGLSHYPAIPDYIMVNNLSITSGASLTVTSDGTLVITGAFSNSGTLTNNGLMILNGSAPQSFPGSTATVAAMHDLEVDNAAGVLIDRSFSISGTLTPTTGTIDLTDKIITLVSDLSGTARVAVTGGDFDYSGGGKFSIERYITEGKGWRLLAAPIAATNAPTINTAWQEGVTSGNPSPGYGIQITGGTTAQGFDQGLNHNPSIKVYNNITDNFTGIPFSPGTNTAITNYPGYFLYIRGNRSTNLMQGANAAQTATTLRMAGQLNTGDVVANVNALNGTVVGNPYPSGIDFHSVTKDNVSDKLYVWDPKLAGTFGLGGYVTLIWNGAGYDATTSVSPVSQYIPSGQAFFVESMDGINPGTLTFKETDKTTSGSDLLFRPLSGNEKLRVNLFSVRTDGSAYLSDGVLTTYGNDYLNAVDNNDARKFYNTAENICIARNNSELAIERRQTIDGDDTTFLIIYDLKTQQYKLQVTAEAMETSGLYAVLKDKYSASINNTLLNMGGVTEIPFTVSSDPASYAIDRFSIVFGQPVILPVTYTSVKAYQQQQAIAVAWNAASETGIAKYELQKSTGGTHFNTISSIVATGNNSAEAQYMRLDENPVTGNNFYRIKSIGHSGQVQYSEVVKVVMGNKATAITVYPNPLQNNTINLQFSNQPVGKYSIRLLNANGQAVYKNEMNITSSNTTEAIGVSSLLAKGMYQLEISGPGNSKTTMNVVN